MWSNLSTTYYETYDVYQVVRRGKIVPGFEMVLRERM